MLWFDAHEWKVGSKITIIVKCARRNKPGEDLNGIDDETGNLSFCLRFEYRGRVEWVDVNKKWSCRKEGTDRDVGLVRELGCKGFKVKCQNANSKKWLYLGRVVTYWRDFHFTFTSINVTLELSMSKTVRVPGT